MGASTSMTVRPIPLYHFTCNHMAGLIGRRGLLQPMPHPLLDGKFVWLTADPHAKREHLGLSISYASELHDCDRMACCYVLDPVPDSCTPWLYARLNLDVKAVERLEQGCDPSTWWISQLPVAVRRVDVRRRAAA